MSLIHPTALIDPSAQLGEGVQIGPYTCIGPEVVIGDGTQIASHVVIRKNTRLGKDNRIFQFASIGEDPQDKKYAGEATYLEIGDANVIREGVTLNRGTLQDAGTTRIGHRNLFMAYAHVGHDCQIGNDCILANQATLGGHVYLDDFAILGGLSAVHQFCRIGAHSMCGGGSIITKDIPAYVLVSGHPAEPHGINLVGLKRRGFSREAIHLLSQAYKIVYRQGFTVQQALEQLMAIQAEEASPELACFIRSLQDSTRGVVR